MKTCENVRPITPIWALLRLTLHSPRLLGSIFRLYTFFFFFPIHSETASVVDSDSHLPNEGSCHSMTGEVQILSQRKKTQVILSSVRQQKGT